MNEKGQVCNDVFILLEGEVEVVNFDLRKENVLKAGDYFGGIISDTRQYAHYETKQKIYFLTFFIDFK